MVGDRRVLTNAAPLWARAQRNGHQWFLNIVCGGQIANRFFHGGAAILILVFGQRQPSVDTDTKEPTPVLRGGSTRGSLIRDCPKTCPLANILPSRIYNDCAFRCRIGKTAIVNGAIDRINFDGHCEIESRLPERKRNSTQTWK